LLDPFSLRIVAWLQVRHSFFCRLVGKEASKGHGHGVSVETLQIHLVETSCIGDQIAPNESPLVVDGVQHPSSPVIVQLFRPFHLRIQIGNGISFGPVHQVIQGSRIAESRLAD